MFETYTDDNNDVRVRLAQIGSELHPEFEDFLNFYQNGLVIFHPEKKPSLKAKVNRTCRFCGKTMPVVTFKKEAHTLPQLAGNRNLISDFECDSCNELFSKYESQLSYFLGLSRTLGSLRGQAGIPKFKTPDKKLEVGFEEGKFKIVSEGLENNHWEIDEAAKELKIISVKLPYIPIQVYKALFKTGLCYIEEKDLVGFEKGLELLQGDGDDDKLKGDPRCRVYIQLLAGAPIPFPVIFRMKKRVDAKHENCPTYCFVFYFGNFILQFFMTAYFPDREVINKHARVVLPVCPAFVSEAYLKKHGKPKRGIFDLSGNEPVKNEKQVITMSFDKVIYPGDTSL